MLKLPFYKICSSPRGVLRPVERLLAHPPYVLCLGHNFSENQICRIWQQCIHLCMHIHKQMHTLTSWPWPLPEAVLRLYFSWGGLGAIAACCWAFLNHKCKYLHRVHPCWFAPEVFTSAPVPFLVGGSRTVACLTVRVHLLGRVLLCVQAYRAAASSQKIFIAFLLLPLSVITLELQGCEPHLCCCLQFVDTVYSKAVVLS